MTILFWILLVGILITNNAVNESIYPSEYIFGGPKKVLMLSTETTTDTNTTHYYYDCRCVDGLQVEKAAFSESDRMAQEVTCDVRYFLAFSGIPVLLYVITYWWSSTMCLPLAKFAAFFGSLFVVVSSIIIISVQSHTDCKRLVECPTTSESAWKRHDFSVFFLFLSVGQLLFVGYLMWLEQPSGRTRRRKKFEYERLR